jgi:hypothetical protein
MKTGSMKRILLSALILSQAVGVFAQARVTKYTAPLAGSVVLKDADDKYGAQVFSLEVGSPDGNAEKKKLADLKKQISQKYPHQRAQAQYKTTAAAAPMVVIDFLADSFPGIPPDNYMAISKDDKAISVINSNIAVLDGKTGQMTYRKSLSSYAAGLGLTGINNNKYDPKVIYDPLSDRYISVILNGRDEYSHIVIGFSKTNDPTGKWFFYVFDGNYKNDTTWFDYPTIAITKDEFFLTGNKIKFSASWQTGFTESVIYQIKKQDGYDSAAAISYQIWDNIAYNGKTIRNLFPVKGGPELYGPDQYFLSNRNFDAQNDSIFLIKVPNNIASNDKNLTVTAMVAPTTYGVPPDGRQPDTSVTLATNDGRILGAYCAYNDEIQFVSTTLNTPSGASAIYHGKISNYKSNPAVSYAQIIGIDTLDFGYPNITFTGNPWGLNQSLISFNYTGPNTYPGLGAILFDGKEYSPLVKVKEGQGSIKQLVGKQQRWGDYTGAQSDWNNTSSVWIEGIYGRADNEYGNWMAKLSSPLLSVKESGVAGNTPARLYPNPAIQFIKVEFDMPQTDVATFAIYNAQGQLVDQLSEAKCKKGKNMLQFNIASLPTGNYFVKGICSETQYTFTRSFVKQ